MCRAHVSFLPKGGPAKQGIFVDVKIKSTVGAEYFWMERDLGRENPGPPE